MNIQIYHNYILSKTINESNGLFKSKYVFYYSMTEVLKNGPNVSETEATTEVDQSEAPAMPVRDSDQEPADSSVTDQIMDLKRKNAAPYSSVPEKKREI